MPNGLLINQESMHRSKRQVLYLPFAGDYTFVLINVQVEVYREQVSHTLQLQCYHDMSLSGSESSLLHSLLARNCCCCLEVSPGGCSHRHIHGPFFPPFVPSYHDCSLLGDDPHSVSHGVIIFFNVFSSSYYDLFGPGICCESPYSSGGGSEILNEKNTPSKKGQ